MTQNNNTISILMIMLYDCSYLLFLLSKSNGCICTCLFMYIVYNDLFI